jgi:lipopolysaccharide export system permease protein
VISTFDRYLLSSFVSAVLIALLAFVTIFLVVDLFEKIDTYVDHDAALQSVARYHLFKLPQIVLLVLPVAMLLGCLFGVGTLAQRNEILPMQNAGVSTNRILLPIYALGLLGSLLAFVLGETLLPAANERQNAVWKAEIKKEPQDAREIRTNVNYLGEGGRHYLIGRYDASRRSMRDVVIWTFAGNTLVERLDAREGQWQADRWTFRDGFLRKFSDAGETAEPFRQITLDSLRETPEDFAKRPKEPTEMSAAELRRLIDKTRASGGVATKDEVEMHVKISFPFSNFILILLGSPLAARRRRSGAAVSFAAAVGVAFLYYGTLRVGQALGTNDTVPPVLGAWLGNVIFGAFAAIAALRARR